MIEVRNVSKTYHRKVLDEVNFTIKDNEFFVIVGTSGCGKTTLLKSINKITTIDEGNIIINGKNINDIKTKQIPEMLGYVVQDGGLFPHLTVEDNISITLSLIDKDKKSVKAQVIELLEMVKLDPNTCLTKYPSQLSGGQKQRVGIARAFATNPETILMDEPFSALDPMTKTALQDEVKELHKAFGKTIVLVTHDMREAAKLADRICIIGDYGNIEQCDTPENIIKKPKNKYVQSFIDSLEV